MMWLTWRQHRLDALGAALVLGACAVFLLATGVHLHALSDGGVARCVTAAATDPTCDRVVRQFENDFSKDMAMAGWLNFLPALLGVFVGAPLLARELEHGTHRLVWTQGITRGHWLAGKVLLLLPAVALAAVVFTAMFSWWLAPAAALNSPLEAAFYDFQGLMPLAYALFAFSLGLAAGAVLGRTIVAMAVTMVGFLAARLPIEFVLRARFMAPLLYASSLVSRPSGNAIALRPDLPARAWILDQGLTDSSGRAVDPSVLPQVCPPTGVKDVAALNQCLHNHGYLSQITYQPADRFWTFQLIEATIFLTLSVALVALAVWWVRRRTV